MSEGVEIFNAESPSLALPVTFEISCYGSVSQRHDSQHSTGNNMNTSRRAIRLALRSSGQRAMFVMLLKHNGRDSVRSLAPSRGSGQYKDKMMFHRMMKSRRV